MTATDPIALRLILHEIRASIRSARKRDLAWVVFGGLPMLAYAIGILANGAVYRAEMLNEPWVWAAAVPVAMLLSGSSLGLFFGRIAQARAHAPFMRALPIGAADRRRMAIIAGTVLGAPFVLLDGGAVAFLAWLVDKPGPGLWFGGAALLSALGFAAALGATLRRPWREPVMEAAASETTRGLSIGWLDRRPAWLGSWAAGLPAGRIHLSARTLFMAAAFALAGLGAIIMSFVNETASAGAVAGVIGGLAIFMMALRCRPLLSPVLRASRLPFFRAWLALMRLPLVLSAGFFGLTALPAYAAEPGAWEIPLAGMMGLIALNLIYGVFAAFFAAAPKLAAFAFFAAIALTFYESLEYSRTIVLGLFALVAFVLIRTRQRYRHG